MSKPGKARALLATLRIANAPSVVSNVFLGYVVGWAFWYGTWNPQDVDVIDWVTLIRLCSAGLLLYFSGNLANDWFDRKWDAERRPERALPSGLFRPSLYLACAIFFALTGCFLAFAESTPCGVCAVTITGLIVLYTWIHKRTMWGVVPMGLCRAGLYFLGHAAWLVGWHELEDSGIDARATYLNLAIIASSMASGLMAYICGLSISARYEGMVDPPRGPRVISLFLLIFPLLAMPCMWMHENPLFGVAGMIPYASWLAYCRLRLRRPIPRYVSGLLAGIPLVDLIAAISLSLNLEFVRRQGAADFPLFWLVIAVPAVAFVAGRALQRLAPAT